MPSNNPYSGVYQGQPGTGAAFIMSGNKAADIFHQNIAQDEQDRKIESYQRQKAQQDQQALIDRNLSAINLDDHWIAHDEELRNKFKALQDYGAKLKAQNINPFTDKGFKDMQNQLQAEAKYSGQLYTGLQSLQKELNDNPDKYSDESIAENKAYYDPKKPLSSYIKEGALAPQLRPRYTLSAMLKGVEGSFTDDAIDGKIIKKADRSKNVQQVLGLQDTPAFKNLVKQAGADPSIGGFPITTADGKTVFTTQDANLLPLVNDYLSQIQPSEYGKLGLISTTPEEAQIEMLNIMKHQNEAYGKVVGAGADALDAQVDGGSKKDWSADSSSRGWANLKLSQERLNNQLKNQAKAQKSEDYLKDLKSGIMKGDSNALGRLNAFLQTVKGKAQFVKGGVVISIPDEDKKTQNALSPFLTPSIGNEKGKKVRVYKIGNSSGQAGEITLDNILKQLNLIKDAATPANYSGELDDLEALDTLDDL